MLSWTEALTNIRNSQVKKRVKIVSVDESLHLVSAEELYSPISFPPFEQSAMDGYAIGKPTGNSFHLKGVFKAGDNAENVFLNDGECYRVFTGAMIPENTYAVIKQEDVNKNEEEIFIEKEIIAGENIRLIGEQCKKDQLILKKDSLINAGTIGFLCMLGIEQVSVYDKPKIKIITTGNELVDIHSTLQKGKIFESNSHTLKAVLNNFHFSAENIMVEDIPEKMILCVNDAIESSDILLITGGISVGDYDFVYDILQRLEVKESFYKIKQKPGKPIFFGQKGNHLIFALPGNPAAVLTCFYLYVLEAIAVFLGRNIPFLEKNKVKLNSDYKKSEKLTCFLKGKLLANSQVEILEHQSSAMLSSFVEADCLIILPEGKAQFFDGEEVEIIRI